MSRLAEATFWSATIAGGLRLATPLIFASIGEAFAQRSGVLNIGLEGYMIVGALASVYVADPTLTPLGFVAGGLAGLLLSTLMVKLGIENAIASGIIVQLMTHGKVRVDFSSLSQRIELIRDEDQLTAPQAMALFEDFSASVKRPEDKRSKHQTSRIVVQKPRS